MAAQQAASSSADGLSGRFEASGHLTSIARLAPVSGVAPRPYDRVDSLANFSSTYDVNPDASNAPTLQVQATDVTDHAYSTGAGTDSPGAASTAELRSANFVLTADPLSTLSILGLAVSASFVKSSSSASFIGGSGDDSIHGDASFGSLTIWGALVGGQTLTFHGDAAPDTVLYSSATVDITLDQQILTFPGAAMGGSGAAPGITTDAIDIRLHGANLFGTTVTGNFVIGETSASLSNWVHPLPV